MKTKRALITLCIVASIAVGLAFTRHKGPTAGASPQPPTIAEHVLYRHLFHHVMALKKRAEQLEKDGKDAAQLRTHFKRQAGLTDAQVCALDVVAARYDEQEKILDAAAKPLIDAYRAQYPGGEVPSGQKPSLPPGELRVLSQQRDALSLLGRDELRAALGADFVRFDNFMKTRVAADTNLMSRR